MSNILNMSSRKGPEGSDIEAEARGWVIDLDGDNVTEEMLQEFRAWLKRSPSHLETYKQIASVWSDLDHWSAFLYPEGETTYQDTAATDVPATGGLLRPVFAIVSVMLVVLGISLFFHYSGTALFQEDRFIAEYASAVGEVKLVTLPDGSDVRLNTRSKIAVFYVEESRIVRLKEGEAFFDVVHDPEKPFVVYAGKYAVKVVGTSFSVQLLTGSVELNVTDGRVEVVALPDKARENMAPDLDNMEQATSVIPIVKGQRAILKDEQDELELVQKVEDEQMEKTLSWRNGLLIFDDDPLLNVVEEINRYSPVRIVIADETISDTRIGGYFRVNDVPAILDTIEKGFGLHVERVDDELIYLMRQPVDHTSLQ